MAELKTRPTTRSATAFLAAVPDPVQRKDAQQVHTLMRRVTGAPAVMWGPSILGYGRYLLRYPNGRELDWFKVGFSPRKGQLVLYLMGGYKAHTALLKRLGRIKTSKACLYVKRLADIDLKILEALLRASVKALAAREKKGAAARTPKAASPAGARTPARPKPRAAARRTAKAPARRRR